MPPQPWPQTNQIQTIPQLRFTLPRYLYICVKWTKISSSQQASKLYNFFGRKIRKTNIKISFVCMFQEWILRISWIHVQRWTDMCLLGHVVFSLSETSIPIEHRFHLYNEMPIAILLGRSNDTDICTISKIYCYKIMPSTAEYLNEFVKCLC